MVSIFLYAVGALLIFMAVSLILVIVFRVPITILSDVRRARPPIGPSRQPPHSGHCHIARWDQGAEIVTRPNVNTHPLAPH